jgi:hypothetical protein
MLNDRHLKWDRILADPTLIYSEPFHPALPYISLDFTHEVKPHRPPIIFSRSKTARPPVRLKYHIVDFSLAVQYPSCDPSLRLEYPPWEGPEHTVPEYWTHEPCDSFKADVYALGKIFSEYFIHGSGNHPPMRHLEFLNDFTLSMISTDPSARPSIKDIHTRFLSIKHALLTDSPWRLRRRASYSNEPLMLRVLRSVRWYGAGLGKVIGRWDSSYRSTSFGMITPVSGSESDEEEQERLDTADGGKSRRRALVGGHGVTVEQEDEENDDLEEVDSKLTASIEHIMADLRLLSGR